MASLALVGLFLTIFGSYGLLDLHERLLGGRDRVSITIESTFASGKGRGEYGVVVRETGAANTQQVESRELYDRFAGPLQAEASVGRRLRTVWAVHFADGESLDVGMPLGWHIFSVGLIFVTGVGLLSAALIGTLRVRRRRRRAIEHADRLASAIGVAPPSSKAQHEPPVRMVRVDWEFANTKMERLWAVRDRPLRKRRDQEDERGASPLRLLRVGRRRIVGYLSNTPGFELDADPVPTLVATIRSTGSSLSVIGKVRKNQPSLLAWIIPPLAGTLVVAVVLVALGSAGLFNLDELPGWVWFVLMGGVLIPVFLAVQEGFDSLTKRTTASLMSPKPSPSVKELRASDVERLRSELEHRLHAGH